MVLHFVLLTVGVAIVHRDNMSNIGKWGTIGTGVPDKLCFRQKEVIIYCLKMKDLSRYQQQGVQSVFSGEILARVIQNKPEYWLFQFLSVKSGFMCKALSACTIYKTNSLCWINLQGRFSVSATAASLHVISSQHTFNIL